MNRRPDSPAGGGFRRPFAEPSDGAVQAESASAQPAHSQELPSQPDFATSAEQPADSAADAPNTHAGKFYERFVGGKGKRRPAPTRSEEPRRMPASERTQRIPSAFSGAAPAERSDAPRHRTDDSQSLRPTARSYERPAFRSSADDANRGPQRRDDFAPQRERREPYQDARPPYRPRPTSGPYQGASQPPFRPRPQPVDDRDRGGYARNDEPSRRPEWQRPPPPRDYPPRDAARSPAPREERAPFRAASDYEHRRPQPRDDFRPPQASREPFRAPRPPFRPPASNGPEQRPPEPAMRERPQERYERRDFDPRGYAPRRPERPAPHMQSRIIRLDEATGQPMHEEKRPETPAIALSPGRDLATSVLLRRLQGGVFVEDLLEDAFAKTTLRPEDRRLAQELTYGSVRWQGALDWLIARKTDGRQQRSAVQVFLRLGLYQLLMLDRIPPHAAVFETVEQAKRLGFSLEASFINAILRRYAAELAPTRTLLEELKATEPHHGFSHPQWLVERWTQRWGAADTRRLLEWNNTPPPTCVRVNQLKTEPQLLLDRWRQKEHTEYDFLRVPWAEDNQLFSLQAHPSLKTMGSFQDGWFYVQDPSTLLAVNTLDPWAGESVLDLCAAPGGKTAYMAQKMENDGELIACDSNADRLQLVSHNCQRLGVTCVQTRALGDNPQAVLGTKQFDKILIDAPCSNTGVLRRRLDLRWRLKLDEFEALRDTQLRLLHLAAPRLKPGGTLVYSTCSLEPEENQEVVDRFLAAHAHFRLESSQELLPFRDAVDGAFVAKFRH